MEMAGTAKKSFVVQMLKFFGCQPGQGAVAFGAEVMALSKEDKVEFAAMLTAAGFPCDPPIATPAAA